MVKSCKYAISSLLLYLFNLSITTRSFPDIWKLAKVRPLFKGGNSDSANNFRPISIIPTIGKIMERIIHVQTIAHFEDYNILSEAQCGFRAGRSTGTCLVSFLDIIYREIDQGGVCGVVSLDLAKAFDTVDHERLIYKLKCYGFRYSCLKWYESYLSSRVQRTIVDDN